MSSTGMKANTFRGLNTAITFGVIVIIFALFTPNNLFINPRNLGAVAKLAPDLGIVALGIGMLMIAGEFDLSIASIIPMSSFMFATMLVAGIAPFPAFLLTLPVGAVMGLINGQIVTRTGLPSFIITLSMLFFWRGIVYGVSRMMPISIGRYFSDESAFERAFTGAIGPVPAQILWFAGIALVLGVILHKTTFGNRIYATGSNEEAALVMGINTRAVKTMLYVIIGILAAFVAVIQATRLGSFAATQGTRFELQAVAAVVIGGTSLRGGVGSMGGIFLGILIIKALENGLILMQVPVFGVNTFIGAAMIAFVILNEFLNRRAG